MHLLSAFRWFTSLFNFPFTEDVQNERRPESISSNIPEEIKKVKKLVKSKITCCLPCNENNIIEDYDYNPSKDFFPDNIDPRRVRFDCKLDYNRDSETLVFKDLNTRERYRNLAKKVKLERLDNE